MAGCKARSVVVHNFGGYENVTVEDFPLPPLDETVEVAVEYGGINFADLYIRQGLRTKNLPFVMGIECVGQVTAIGSQVLDTNFKMGQNIICYDVDEGVFRDRIRISPKHCFSLPDYIDAKTGCAVFVNYLTAWYSLIELGHLRENEKLLLQSCAGGVGIAATQIAKTIKGVEICGIASRSKEDQAKQHGIYRFFSNEGLKTEIVEEKFDLIVANQGGSMFSYLQGLLKPLGRIIIIGANNAIVDDKKINVESLTTDPVPVESLIAHNRVVAGLHLGILLNQERTKIEKVLENIFELIRDEKLRPVIDSVWPMSKIVEASKRLSERKNVGKVLIYMKE